MSLFENSLSRAYNYSPIHDFIVFNSWLFVAPKSESSRLMLSKAKIHLRSLNVTWENITFFSSKVQQVLALFLRTGDYSRALENGLARKHFLVRNWAIPVSCGPSDRLSHIKSTERFKSFLILFIFSVASD